MHRRDPLFTGHPGLPHAQPPRLLVVDDQPHNIRLIYNLFADDCQVLMATSGAQGLQICRQQQPDLVLLDLVMPGMDGLEVCRQLQEDSTTQHIPIIFVTASNDADTETRSLEAGAVDFVTKPINPSVLRARVRTHVLLKRQTDAMRTLVFHDGLTGVYNRRYFDQQLEHEWARANRSGLTLSLIMLDIDHFKRYNDLYGHQAGDNCLCQVASLVQSCFRRSTDIVARYGGEEFACLLPETPFGEALRMATEVEHSIRAMQLEHADSEPSHVVTVSVGVSARQGEPDQSDAAALVAAADRQLYHAKKEGRSRVCGALLVQPPGSAADQTSALR